MVNFCAVCGCCTQTDNVREHLEDTLRIGDVSAKGLYRPSGTNQTCDPAIHQLDSSIFRSYLLVLRIVLNYSKFPSTKILQL